MTKRQPSKPRGSSESLLSPTALGGVLARKGMRFQDLWLLHKLASWVIDPWFRGFVNEGREDVDTFRFEDERRREFLTVRWQLKDRHVTRALLAEVLSGFYAQHRERLAHRSSPISQFHLVAPGAQEDVWTLPDILDRVRHARVAYGAKALELSASVEDLNRRLEKLRVPVDETFVGERVHLDFRAGWAQFDEHYWKTLQALLQALDVASDRTRDAANHLFTIVSGQIGELIGREAILKSLESFRRRIRTPSRAAKAPGAAAKNVRPTSVDLPPGQTSSHCLISYFPDEAVLLEFPDRTCGLIDCGPAAIRHIVQYLSDRSIKALSFLALTHWHITHYAGVPALLNAVSRIENVFLNLDADRHAVLPWRSQRRGKGLVSESAKGVVNQLVARAQRDGGHVRYNRGLHWIYGNNRDSESDFVCGFAPEVEEYRFANDSDINNLSAVFLVQHRRPTTTARRTCVRSTLAACPQNGSRSRYPDSRRRFPVAALCFAFVADAGFDQVSCQSRGIHRSPAHERLDDQEVRADYESCGAGCATSSPRTYCRMRQC